jgi:hypothetical protein
MSSTKYVNGVPLWITTESNFAAASAAAVVRCRSATCAA